MQPETRYVVFCLDEKDSPGDAAHVKLRRVLTKAHLIRRARGGKERLTKQWQNPQNPEPTKKRWLGSAITGSMSPTLRAPPPAYSCGSITYPLPFSGLQKTV